MGMNNTTFSRLMERVSLYVERDVEKFHREGRYPLLKDPDEMGLLIDIMIKGRNLFWTTPGQRYTTMKMAFRDSVLAYEEYVERQG